MGSFRYLGPEMYPCRTPDMSKYGPMQLGIGSDYSHFSPSPMCVCLCLHAHCDVFVHLCHDSFLVQSNGLVVVVGSFDVVSSIIVSWHLVIVIIRHVSRLAAPSAIR